MGVGLKGKRSMSYLIPWQLWNAWTDDRLKPPLKNGDMNMEAIRSAARIVAASQTCLNGILRNIFDFSTPYWLSLHYFQQIEKRKVFEYLPQETARDYIELFLFNMNIARRGALGTARIMNSFHAAEAEKWFSSWLGTLTGHEEKDLLRQADRVSQLIQVLVYDYPKAILDIEPFFGFHFNDGGYIKAAETDRFILYQVLPWKGCAKVRPAGKPVLVIPPYVLGASILAFLPGENKSYTHCFANQGIPTYIRIMKDIQSSPAVQTMTGEDDCRDTRHFCEIIQQRHGKPVTLNGFCQGGYVALLSLLSGKLDGLVDAFITCVAPMDGTRSRALAEYLALLPTRFRDLGYATKTLSNGNQVIDGTVMSWVFKLKSIEQEAPLVTLYRDLDMFNRQKGDTFQITPTAAALNYWLIYERNDLPVGLTKLSFDSYTKPVTKDGTLPVKLFGRSLNFKRLQGKKIPWLLCYAAEDDLVDPRSALAPADYIDVEVTEFPRGHGAVATSWPLPSSECALHKQFLNGARGPVRFQLDLDEQSDSPVK